MEHINLQHLQSSMMTKTNHNLEGRDIPSKCVMKKGFHGLINRCGWGGYDGLKIYGNLLNSIYDMNSRKLAVNRAYRMNYLSATYMRLKKLEEERNGNGKRRYSEKDIADIENNIR